MNSKFKNFDDDFSGKVQNVFIVFLSRRCLVQIWDLYLIDPTMLLYIYKDDGDIDDENNYGPISVVGHIAKMTESPVIKILIFLRA